MSGFLHTFPRESLSFDNSALYPFAVINHSQEYNYMLCSSSLPSESWNLRVILGTSDSGRFVLHFFWCVWGRGSLQYRVNVKENERQKREKRGGEKGNDYFEL